MEAIYYIWGNEAYLIDQKIQELIAERQQETQGETEVIYLDTEEMKPQQWAQELEFSPLFQLSRIVIMKRPPWLMAGKKKVKNEKMVCDFLEEYIRADYKGQILILTATEKNATNSIVKLLSRKASFIECSKPNPKQIEIWIKEQAARKGCTFSDQEIVRQLANSGQDLYYLFQLIQKMALLAPDGVISKEMMLNQVEYKTEVKIFKLLDGIFERKVSIALEALGQLLNQGESEIYILYMINKQFILYAQIKALSEEGKSSIEIEKETGQKPYTVKKMLKNIRKYSWNDIERNIQWLLQTDIDLKSSSKPPKMVLEVLITLLIKGESSLGNMREA